MGGDSSQPETRDQKPETDLPETTHGGDFVTSSADETFALAMRIGKNLKGGEIFLLKGDLGAGKTVFAKGLAAGVGVDPVDVTSPTFTLVNSHEGRLRFFHVDLYRLEPGAHQELGLEEIFDCEESVAVIEWAERLELAPARSIVVEMAYVSNSERRIIISA